MTAFESIMNELKEMRNHFDSGFSLLERQRIIELYMQICNKSITNPSCNDCYRDAFVEVFSKLQRMGELPEERHYKLKEGKCLHIFGTSDYLFDVTDKQAEKFLSQFPSAIENFAKYPADWEERVSKSKTKAESRKTAKAKRDAKKAVEEANNNVE